MQFLYKNSSLISSDEIQKNAARLAPYISHLQEVVASKDYHAAESSINLPSDEKLVQKVVDLKNKLTGTKLKYIVDIGIGGSNLGTKAVYDALFGYYDVVQPNRFPKMIFLDTNDEGFLSHFLALVASLETKDQFIINAISKSGGTTETIANLEVALAGIEKKFGNIQDRLVITTDENSPLWNLAIKKNVYVLPIPKQVGGRYSVLSAVGLFPLACANVDIHSLLQGAENMRKICVNSTISENPAVLSATILYLQSKNKKTINDNFIFSPRLESCGKWYRQLMGESIGKEKDLEGKVVHAGITPTVSIGSTDLHSVGQLYLGGPKDKITTFISTEDSSFNINVPDTLQFPLVSSIEGKSIISIMAAIREGVKVAYSKQALPFTEVILEHINENALGEFLQFKMIEMMYLGKLLNVNTFDQPHVELYKTETKRILAE